MKAIWIVSIVISVIGAALLSSAVMAGADASGPQVALALVLIVLPYFGVRVIEAVAASRGGQSRKPDQADREGNQ